MMSDLLKKKAVVGIALLTVSGAAMGWGCPAVVDSVWQAGLAAAQVQVEGALTQMYASVSNTRSINLQRLQSALKVLAKQIDTSSEASAAMNTAAKQASANFQSDLSLRKQVFNTILDFDPATGQGYDPCGELKRSQNVAVAIGEAATDMKEKVVREIDAAPGRFVADPGAIVSARLKAAKGVYCTVDEAKAGLCGSPGAMAGKDVDASHFFTSFNQVSPQNDAKSAMLNNMYGVPYQTVGKETFATPAGKSFLEAKRTEDAVRSVSQASLKSIQSWTEAKGDVDNGSASVLDTLAKKVGTYAGGDNYASWEQGKTAQSERGLLVEFAKMQAAELYFQHLEYQQMERQEALVAAMVATAQRASSKTPIAGTNDAAVRAASTAAKVK
jgi:hypothetical protein